MEPLPLKPLVLPPRFLLFSLPLLLACFLRGGEGSWAAPFRAADVLPLLPGRASWAILKHFNGADELLPAFVGTVSPTSSPEWEGACFADSKAHLEIHSRSNSQFGGGTIHLQTTEPGSKTCIDVYIFVTPYRVAWGWYFLRGEHTLEIDSWEGQEELDYVRNNGISIFLMRAGIVGTLRAMADFFPLFMDSEQGESANLEFLEKHMGAQFAERPKPAWVSDVRAEDLRSGDFLAASKIRGRWGAFQTLEKWVTGAHAGHAAVCLRDPQGKLWVAESGREDKKGEDVVALTPWEEWWDFSQEDESNPHIALLPLHPDVRAKFDASAAWSYAKNMSGKPYGYHNLIFSWIDTAKENYPPIIDSQLVASSMTILNKMKPAYAGRMLNEALNKRLGTQGLDLPQVIAEAGRRGGSLAELLTVPEQDDWTYSDGKSVSCVAFVVQVYKEAGLFGSLANSIQATEFTVRDAYMLKLFEDDRSRLPEWCNNGDDVELPFCQIRGKYRMELPQYNTIEPYQHMNEKCPSLPPKYLRSPNC